MPAISLSEKYIPHLIFDDCFLQTQLWHSGPPTNFWKTSTRSSYPHGHVLLRILHQAFGRNGWAKLFAIDKQVNKQNIMGEVFYSHCDSN